MIEEEAGDSPQLLGEIPKAQTLWKQIRSSRTTTIMASCLFLNPIMVMHDIRITSKLRKKKLAMQMKRGRYEMNTQWI